MRKFGPDNPRPSTTATDPLYEFSICLIVETFDFQFGFMTLLRSQSRKMVHNVYIRTYNFHLQIDIR